LITSPHVTFTTPSKPSSPVKDDTETMEPKDPDPFLSVNMENLRNRRRHSLAPPTPPNDGSAALTNGIRSLMTDASPSRGPGMQPPESPIDSNIPTKRARTLPHRPSFMETPVFRDDVLVRVFSFLDVNELLRLRQVNRQWRRLLGTSDEVCHYVDLSTLNRKVTDDFIIKVLAPFVGNRAITIDLNNCFHITDEGFSTLWRLCGRNVKTWRMRSVWDVSASQILEMSENAKELEEVDWSNCRKVGDNLLGRVVGWIIPDSPPSTRQVVISSSNKPKTRQQSQQQQLQQQQQQQQQAKTPNMPAPGTVIGCSKLHTLNLSYCKHITDRSMAHLAAHASSRIRSLSLTRCTSITDAGFQAWAPFKFEKLTHLCLADCTYLSDNAIVALVNAAKNLTHLDLSFCCALSDTATEVVALGLPRLQELRLAFCGSAVSDASLESVALHLNDLEGISVRGCVRVTGKGVENILRGCGQISWIDASQCRNLEPWLRMGGVEKWGYDDKLGKPPNLTNNLEQEHPNGQANGGTPLLRTSSVPMLSTPSFLPQSGLTMMSRRARQPVRFVIEKGQGGLR
jgi:F-box and leucine-rich repeat protein 7